MKTHQLSIRAGAITPEALASLAAIAPQLLLVFAAPGRLDAALGEALKRAVPGALSLGCSTCGEISDAGVDRDTTVLTAVHFDDPALVGASTEIAGMDDSRDAGRRLAAQLKGDGLRGVLVFGQGVAINGSAMLEGMTETFGPDVVISGGLAGDDGAFVKTQVLYDGRVSDRLIAAVGFRSPRTLLAHGSFGGWQPFGPARRVTRCEGNILYELDGAPALETYKRYLGAHADALPASGLLFPFAMLDAQHDQTGLIRTILGVNEADGSLVLAGDVHADGYLRLMHASTDSLVEGAQAAAEAARAALGASGDGLTVLVSCVGRKLVMGARVDEEVEAVGEVFGHGTTLTGFYSHGEISPMLPSSECRLHNQTMTVTFVGEA
jgi:hypothetical protein